LSKLNAEDAEDAEDCPAFPYERQGFLCVLGVLRVLCVRLARIFDLSTPLASGSGGMTGR
jgi:hypothetical protein